MQIREASRADLPGIVTLLRNANDIPYDLARVAEEKCFGAGVAGEPRTLVAVSDDQPVGVAVTCGRSLRLIAVDRAQRRKGIGTRLLLEAESGRSVIHAGAEAGNYFVPGVSAEHRGLRRFFEQNGYERFGEEAVDLEVRLTDNDLISAPRDQAVRRAISKDRGEALDFIERRFARAWRLEAERAFENAKPTVFLALRNGRIVGFSAHNANNRGLGFFGPEGVATEARGHGLGAKLLLASLADLREMGFQRTIIAWAAAHDFYRRVAGAVVAHTFLRMRKQR